MSAKPSGSPPSSRGFEQNVAEASLKVGDDFGQYRITRMLGVGGMGEVYEVAHRVLDTRHALKLINKEVMKNEVALDYFKTEGRVMAQLHHPGIVLVDEFGETDGRYWLRMELMPGVGAAGTNLITLEDYVWHMGGRLPEEEVRECMRQFLDAIGFAHTRGVIHRDLKPTNILLHPTGMKISDFGLVKMAGASWHEEQIRSSISGDLEISQAVKNVKANHESRSADRAIVGTFEFMAPEQKRGDGADTRSDLYAVGLICFQILTGRETPGFRRPSELVGGINPEWDAWLEKALAQDPEERFQDAEEMRNQLPMPIEAKAKEKGTSPPAPVKTPANKFPDWFPYLIGGATAAVLALVIGIILLARGNKQRKVVIDETPPTNLDPTLSRPNPLNPKSTGGLAIGEDTNIDPLLKIDPKDPLSEADSIFLERLGLEKTFEEARKELLQQISVAERTHKTFIAPIPRQDVDTNPATLPPVHPSAGFRNWRSPDGTDIEASLINIKDEQLILRDAQGTIEYLPKEGLREEDLKYINEWSAAYVPSPKQSFLVHSAGIHMCWIPPGEVILGNDEPKAGFPEESPQTTVKLTKGYWIGKYEVTQRQMQLIMGINPSQFGDNPDHPAEKVSWAKASAFCTRLTEFEQDARRLPPKWEFRLPSEAQWEHACKATNSNDLHRNAWHSQNSGGSTRRIGLLEPNRHGIHDMQGNVKEWVRDVFSIYPGGNQKDWLNESGGLNHILRGGSWKSPPEHCRNGVRFKPRSDYEGADAGFRIALVREADPRS